jgi:hypothetical protein
MTTRTDEELYAILKDMPDFDRFPLPEHWYEKFKIPRPEILTPMEAIRLADKVANAPGPLVITEVREPAPGGVRPLLEAPVVPVEITTISSDESAACEPSLRETAVNQESQ